MEWKIGEIFEYNGEWYQCVVGNDCENCAFNERKCYTVVDNSDPIGDCCADRRKDNKDVIFKKLEKVGEPYEHCGKLYQCYKLPTEIEIRLLPNNFNPIGKDNLVEIEIKQTKEDMEGKTNLYEKQTPLQKLMEIYCDGRMDYNEFEKKVKELYSDKGDDSKPILKPFDIQKAREGKPVCTRDGRKARIICTDTKGDPCPIIALVEENGIEAAYHYDKNGQNAYNKNKLDLMMLPEKKEGWVNIDKVGSGKITISSPYSTKEEAIHNDNECTIDTVKINWEE